MSTASSGRVGRWSWNARGKSCVLSTRRGGGRSTSRPEPEPAPLAGSPIIDSRPAHRPRKDKTMMKETHLLFDGEAGENENREPVSYTLSSRKVVVASDTIPTVSQQPPSSL